MSAKLKVQQEKAAELEVLNGQEGTAIKITDPKGFGGALTGMVGLANDGTILGYKVLESSETPGLGAKAQDWFQKGQKGDIIGKQAGNLSVSKDGGEVDAIIITGGIAHSNIVTEKISSRCRFIAPIEIYAGENELQALAMNAMRVLQGQTEAKIYQ